MTARERILAALAGRRADRVPFTMPEWMVGDAEAVAPLCRAGLGIVRHANSYRATTPHVVYASEAFERDGCRHTWDIIHTPVGEVARVRREGRVEEYYIKRPGDYRVLEFVACDTVYERTYDTFQALDRELGPRGVTIINGGRSPLQTILVDYAGPERFRADLADGCEELLSLYHALAEKQRELFWLIADGPGQVVKLWEALTDEAIGGEQFAEFHQPLYHEYCSILHAHHKRLVAHVDGRMARLNERLAATGLDALEALTPAPEGELSLAQARQCFPGKALWISIPGARSLAPPEELRAYADQLLYEAQPWKGLLFEISGELPANWREAVPVILDALAATRQ